MSKKEVRTPAVLCQRPDGKHIHLRADDQGRLKIPAGGATEEKQQELIDALKALIGE